ncbi:MAG: 5'/3'-nucleotidase SurE [Treponema sp.]|uniref:5'/3'-nucleotidase SurE n=1 Tax=Treponema sp. TaxID=166 RepID=UPI00298DAF91|nr:5'/3'-nucleotidase SurE [Treponema sp.]MBR5932950.1 5'/3'-nucleotidase SurE [Treponema sp.]
MNVLITNDDGYGAWGIEALIKAVSKKHNVYVVAPDGNRSGNSMCIHLYSAFELYKKGERDWACTGTPADCVNVALKSNLLGCKIDAVLSGINKGQNIGTDILYSGTCGAAKGAAIFGIPAVAVSMQLSGGDDKDWNDRTKWHFDVLASFVADNLEKLCSLCRPSIGGKMPEKKCAFININSRSLSSFKGVKITDVCYREYTDDRAELSEKEGSPDTLVCTFLGGEGQSNQRSYSDYQACCEGYISVTRVVAEPSSANDDLNLDSIEFSL